MLSRTNTRKVVNTIPIKNKRTDIIFRIFIFFVTLITATTMAALYINNKIRVTGIFVIQHLSLAVILPRLEHDGMSGKGKLGSMGLVGEMNGPHDRRFR